MYIPKALTAIFDWDNNLGRVVRVYCLCRGAQGVPDADAIGKPQSERRQEIVWCDVVIHKRYVDAVCSPITHLTHPYCPGDACAEISQDERPQTVVPP